MSQDAFFTDDSIIRRVLRETVVAFSGPRALLMMAAHPVAFEGFFASTGSLDDPYARLRRTAIVMDEIVWGSRRRAEAYCARVRQAHAGVRGVLPEDAGRFGAGTPYAADDPELLLWVLACLVDSATLVHERYIGPLPRADRDALWDDYRVVGRLFGLRDEDMPADSTAFEAYVQAVVDSGDLWVTDRARELGTEIVLHPPVPLKVRPILELANFVTVGLLPPRVRRGFGLSWDPARSVALSVNAEYVRRVVMPVLPAKVRYTPPSRGQASRAARLEAELRATTPPPDAAAA